MLVVPGNTKIPPFPASPVREYARKMAKEGEDDERIRRRRGQLTATAALPIRGPGHVGETFGNYSTGSGQIRVDPAVDMIFAALTTGILTQAQTSKRLSEIMVSVAL
jgi:hypothetical protein